MAWQETHKYDDIINQERPRSPRHAPMPMIDRGAQFSPFAALVGYEAVLQESARQTEQETFLDESGKELLDQKLRTISQQMEQAGEITFLCFEQDEWKPGGRFVPVRGRVKKIDLYRQAITMEDGREIWIDSIRAIEGVD